LESSTSLGLVKGWIRADKTKDFLTAGKLEVLLPGISEAYGANTPVDIYFHTYSIRDFTVNANDSEMKSVSTLDLQAWLPNKDGVLEYAAGLGLEDVKFGFKALTDDMDLTFGLT